MVAVLEDKEATLGNINILWDLTFCILQTLCILLLVYQYGDITGVTNLCRETVIN